MKIGTEKETSYGMKFLAITPKEWEVLRPLTYQCNWSDYDRLMVEMHIGNCGYGILSAEYQTPIDNEYDLAEIYTMLETE